MPDAEQLIARYWPLPEQAAVARQLVAGYEASDRSYHDTRHLAEVLDRVDLLLDREGAGDTVREVVVLAAWFHDAVYDVVGDNEERSAKLAERILARTPLSAFDVEEVARLVRLTATHDPGEHDLAGAVLCDADLGILAAEPVRYGDYVAGVRREYAHVTAEDFTRGRAAVLRRLVDRARLFHTEYARTHWEEAARRNVAAELRRLDRDAAEA